MVFFDHVVFFGNASDMFLVILFIVNVCTC
jgi:hypothetical protein